MPKLRRSGGRPVTSSSCTRMRPWSGASKPAIRRSAVVLPLPEGPSSARISPFSTASERPRRTGWAPKLLSSRSRTRKDMPLSRRWSRAAAAHGAVPGGHPFLAVLRDQVPIHAGRLELLEHLLRPLRQALGGEVGARRQAEGVAGRQLLRLDAADVLDEGLRLLRVPGAF